MNDLNKAIQTEILDVMEKNPIAKGYNDLQRSLGSDQRIRTGKAKQMDQFLLEGYQTAQGDLYV